MSNNELIDAYLADKMPEAARADFEAQLANDPGLQQEFAFQQEITHAIKHARVMELKAMLNNVVVGGSGNAANVAAKVITSLVTIGIISYCIFYYSSNSQQHEETTPLPPTTEEKAPTPDSETTIPTVRDEKNPLELEGNHPPQPPIKNTKEKAKDATSKVTETEEKVMKKTAVPITLILPSSPPEYTTGEEKDDSIKAPDTGLISSLDTDHSTLDVSVDDHNSKFSFHYQFKHGKLFLYGSFDKGLYEILEFNTKKSKPVFLYYKDKYYALQREQEKITPLDPIKEPTLIEKLEEVRTGS